MKIEHLTKAYGEKVIFSDFTLPLPETGIVSLTGPSGCGKTTLLRLICGLEPITAGNLDTEGARIAVVFQEPRLLPHRTAAENLTVACGCTAQQAEEMLESFGFNPEDCRKFPRELSGGMQQRVALSRALLFGGEVYLLDEAFRGLEEELRRDAIRRFAALKDTALILNVTHQPEEMKWLGGEVVTLSRYPCQILSRAPAQE